MRARTLIASSAVALVALSPLSGCGDDDGGDTASDDAALIAKADFIQAANAACEQRNQQMQAKLKRLYAKAAGKPRDEAAREIIEEVIAPGFEAEAKDLRALEPPPGEEEEVDAVITAIEEMVARTRRDLAAGRKYPYRKTENVAAAYGLPACGRP
jgi:hypothetical protein